MKYRNKLFVSLTSIALLATSCGKTLKSPLVITVKNNTTNVVLRKTINVSNKYVDKIEAEEVPPFELTTYDRVTQYRQIYDPNAESVYSYKLISEEESKPIATLVFKKTFIVKNDDSEKASIDYSLKLANSNQSKIVDIMRIMLLGDDNGEAVYAKKSKSPHLNDEGNETYREYISLSPDEANRMSLNYYGFAESFESNSVILSRKEIILNANEERTFTVVVWLEGYDPDCNGEAPKNAKAFLSFEINAFCVDY